jgi:hypothetical protein
MLELVVHWIEKKWHITARSNTGGVTISRYDNLSSGLNSAFHQKHKIFISLYHFWDPQDRASLEGIVSLSAMKTINYPRSEVIVDEAVINQWGC